MQFKINQKVFDTFPDFKVGVLVLSNFQQNNSNEIASLLKKAVENTQNISDKDERLEVWRNAFEKLGLNSKEAKPAHIALLDRVKKNKQLPSIFPIVDIANSVSLEHLVPIGTHTLDSLSDDVEIRFTSNDDSFTPMRKNEPEKVETGILAYVSDKHVLTKNLVWRQGETSKITASSQNVLVPIDTFANVSENKLLEVMAELENLFRKILNADVKKAIISKTNNTFSFKIQTDQKELSRAKKQNILLTRAVEQVLPSTDSLQELMAKKKIRVYFGIDPSGAFLTLGHSIALRKLQAFADAGHEAILLIGNGTVRIGDPTGKDSSRPVLTDEQIEANFKDWQKQASKVLDFSKIKVVRNGDWLDKLNYADIIKLLAKTTVQQLLERDMFQERLKNGQPIHGHEIIYPLIQGYDSVEMEVDLEIGGTDQTFNMMMGRTLLKSYKDKEKWVLTTPIINGTDGRKMSKSFGNYVALTDAPNDMYGKLMSISDEQIISYFELLTDIDLKKIKAMQAEMDGGENPMKFKKQLAFEITKMYHTEADAKSAEEHFEKTVQAGEALENLSLAKPEILALELAKKARPEASNSELRRLIEQGGLQINDEKHTDPNEIIQLNSGDKLKVGKRNLYRINRK